VCLPSAKSGCVGAIVFARKFASPRPCRPHSLKPRRLSRREFRGDVERGGKGDTLKGEISISYDDEKVAH